jgi:hypothetical protein
MFSLLEKREARAGIGLALTSLSPLIAGALGLPLLVTRRKASLWFVLAMLVLMIYSLTLIGFQGVKDFIGLLRLSSQGEGYGLNQASMYNLLGFLIRSFPSVNIDKIRSIAWAASILSILAMCIYWWNKQERLNIKHICMAVVLATFTAPHLHLHGLSYLLLPLLGITIMLYDQGRKEIALLLIPITSTILLLILFLASGWNFAIYYLLMLFMFIALITYKPEDTTRRNFSS